MNWDAKIGEIDWDACDKCIHCPPDTGGCDLREGEIDISELEVDGEFLFCRNFKEREKTK